MLSSNLSPFSKEQKEEQVIYNTKSQQPTTQFTQTNRGIVAGSHYNNILLEPGVRFKEEEKSKNGGTVEKNQFGRMSLKEYEQMRNHYMRASPTHENEIPKVNKSQYEREYIPQKETIGKFVQIAEQNIMTSNIKHASTLKNVNPTVAYSKLSDFNWNDERNEREVKNNSNNHYHQVIHNEDIFKNRRTIDIQKRNTMTNNHNFINNFNNQILSNDNWGTASNNNKLQTVNEGYSTMVHSHKRVFEQSLRSRKKK